MDLIFLPRRGTQMGIVVNKTECVGCEECLHVCPVEAIIMKDEKAEIVQHRCDQCERCIPVCPVKAINIVSAQLHKGCM
ncbi:MAG: 4Fe-4S dicluster domain-containing protein [Candidatus Brocadia sp.]|nr:4Fe-4S dicluster domain-containing protein [Candidatus Brocadia sp.]